MLIINHLELLSARGFDKAFWLLLNKGEFQTHTGAYEYLEDVYILNFKRRKYASFESFRKARTARQKAKKKP